MGVKVPWRHGVGSPLLALALLLAACGAPGPAPRGEASAPREAEGPSKRVTVAILGDPVGIYPDLYPPDVSTAGTNRGIEALQDMIATGLALFDNRGVLRPALGEAVPSLENGLWRLFPDGRMETTWRIREGVRWHDGTFLTSSDLAFAIEVGGDKELPRSVDAAFGPVGEVQTPDARTITVTWDRPFIEADTMFTRSLALPLARHALEPAYRENKANFLSHPVLLQEPMGAGPYRVRDWERGSHLMLEAFDAYVPRRPSIDVIEVRFISDPNTLIANLLAGAVELTLGRTISLEQALHTRDQWKEGRMETAPAGSLKTRPQHFGPNPAVVGEPAFRRALLHAIDRGELVDSLLGGQGSVAHSIVAPNEALHAEIEGSIARYDYDPRRALEMIQGLGYARGPDGFFRDAAGEKLTVEHRTLTTDINAKTLYIMTDYWRRAGVEVDPVIIPPPLAQNRQYRDSYPAFETQRGNPDLYSLSSLMSTGRSRHRYNSQEFDQLVGQYSVTIALPARIQLLRQIVRRMTEDVVMLDLFWDVEPAMIGNRLRNVGARHVRSSNTWNVQDWDVVGDG